MLKPAAVVGRVRPTVLLAYAAFVLIGINAGVSGVLIVEQIRDYGVDRATIGLTFFTGSAGFVLGGATVGALIHRFGLRTALAFGSGLFVLAGLYTATRPPFVAFVVLQLAVGYAIGVLESVLNTSLAALPNATTLLNRLHAFFGVGALIGPVLATWLVGFAPWTVVWLVQAVAGIPLVAGFLAAYPKLLDGSAAAAGGPAEPEHPSGGLLSTAGMLLATALRRPALLLGAALLTVYVGLELGMGNWAFSYLVEARDQGTVVAGYTVSGYWLGLTLGRFLISPVATRWGATASHVMLLSLVGVLVAAVLTWLVPVAAAASVGLVLLGFFLGPIFPTTMAVAPQLAGPGLVATAIGVLNAGSVVGGAVLPWLAGAIGQSAGIWTLLPFTVALAVLQLVVWWPMARHLRAADPR